jgi:hypothetical protein
MPTRDQSGNKHHNWQGGRIVHAGYVFLYCPNHPRQNKRYVQEHVLVVERALGHLLPLEAVVHHTNEVKSDNQSSNLAIFQDVAYHNSLHARLRVLRAGGDPWTQAMCTDCGPRNLNEFDREPSGKTRCRCRNCHRTRMRNLYRSRPREMTAL